MYCGGLRLRTTAQHGSCCLMQEVLQTTFLTLRVALARLMRLNDEMCQKDLGDGASQMTSSAIVRHIHFRKA